MYEAKIGTQIVIGKHEVNNYSTVDVMEKLESFHANVGLGSLMIWNNAGPEWYKALLDFCEKNEIHAYLWFPVLADWIEGEPDIENIVCTANGKRGYGIFGVWDQFNLIDEDFLFLCPTKSEHIKYQEKQLEKLISKYDFHGVFLDRIRFPSPANGIEMLFSCFCDRCCNIHSREVQKVARKGLDYLSEFLNEDRRIGWEKFLEEIGLYSFLKKREAQIESVVSSFSEISRNYVSSVGLDLFSPCLAPFVGQNYTELSIYCDWIKSMTYMNVVGPAGLLLEIKSLVEGIREYNNYIPEIPQTISFIEALLDLPKDSLQTLMIDEHVQENLIISEIKKARRLSKDVEVIPGVEFVKHPHFPNVTSTNQAQSYLKAINKIGGKFIASWNALYIPESTYHLFQQQISGTL